MSLNYNLYLKRDTCPIVLPLSILQVKGFLSIDANYSDQDELLVDLLKMATDYAEWYTEKSFMEQEWKIVCIGVVPNRLYLPFGPIIEVKMVSSDDVHKLAKDDYRVEEIGGYIEFLNNACYRKVEIIYASGHKSAGEVPAVIKEGILNHISCAYHNRDGTQFISKIKRLYDQFRELRLTL